MVKNSLKIKKPFIIIALVVFITAALIVTIYFDSTTTCLGDQASEFQQDPREKTANNLYRKIIEYVQANEDVPYTGAFIDDYGVLNVGLVDEDNKYKKIFKELAGNTSINFYYGKRTYEELRKAQIDLSEIDWRKLDLGITSIYVNEKTNKLVIGLKDENSDKYKINIKELVIENTELHAEDIEFEYDGEITVD